MCIRDRCGAAAAGERALDATDDGDRNGENSAAGAAVAGGGFGAGVGG